MFNKFTTCLDRIEAGLDKILDFPYVQLADAINRRYPDLAEVLELLERIGGDSPVSYTHLTLPTNREV